MIDDVLLNKIQIIERCIIRIHEEYQDDQKNLQNYTKQDSIILNIQRCCEAAIDLAMHLIAKNKWGVPQSSRDAFIILQEHGAIELKMAEALGAMVGFRNIAVHDYQKINLEVVKRIIEVHLNDLRLFARIILNHSIK